MPISLTIDQDLSKATAWTRAVQKQLPFATSVALNNVAFDARKGLTKGLGVHSVSQLHSPRLLSLFRSPRKQHWLLSSMRKTK